MTGPGRPHRSKSQTTTVPLLPAAITVYPQPQLDVNYFIQHSVFGDNPFTNQNEAPVPFDLGLQVSNVGAGAADSFSITSAQPKIISKYDT